MSTAGTLDDILGQIQALVSDKLQVVSYKWLSRNFSMSSNDAKRVLQEFVNKHGNELEVIYTLSGWLKKNPEIYNVRLVSGSNLTDAKQQFKDNYSVQVYSVQTCIPKDPAVIWSAEFVQAEELFDQPSTTDNCLRDNRFCGVSNLFVKRIVNGKSIALDPPKTKIGSEIAVPSKISRFSPSFATHQQGQTEQPKPKSGIQSPAVVGASGNEDASKPNVQTEPSKAQMSKEKASGPVGNKKKVANEKAPQGGNAGSLANLWGRASAKPKPQNPTVDSTHDVSRTSATSDAQVCAQEALDSVSSDDEGQNISHKESNGGVGRKRRVVFDFSDDEDEENIVSLASPEPPNSQSILGTKKNAELETVNLNFDEQRGEKVEVKPEKASASNSRSLSKEYFERSRKTEITGHAMPDKSQDLGPENLTESNKRDQANNTSSTTSPKRKKVLKTRIDERGREVTEVVWEGGPPDRSKVDNAAERSNNAADKSKVDTIATNNSSDNRLPPVEKTAASRAPSNPVSKSGSTKTTKTAKDNKQANILSFFKKV